ncbi:MAG: hypothetical protein LBL91_03810, partial [Lachnospiraceae bacterium]|nr:hypothetical protein [Lachnospiraceae bacterium]
MTRTKKIVLIISAVVVVAAVAAVVLFFTTNLFDAFKSPKTLFYQYVDKMSEAMPESTYESFLNELKESKGKSYKSSANIAVEMESHSYQYKETAEILNGLGMSV